jgi:hypothetical protein
MVTTMSTETGMHGTSIRLYGDAVKLDSKVIDTICGINYNYKNGDVTDVWYLHGVNRGSVHVKFQYGSAMYSFRVDGNTVLYRGVRRTIGFKIR